jgi:hypothetical protein
MTAATASALNASYADMCVQSGWIESRCRITFGASSITAQLPDDPAITFTRTGAGTYTLTFPAGIDVEIYSTNILSPALTVNGSVLTAVNASAGTATMKITGGAGVATDPATGDIIQFMFAIRDSQ